MGAESVYGAVAVGGPWSWAAPTLAAPIYGVAFAPHLARERRRSPAAAGWPWGAAHSVPRDGTATVHGSLRGMSLSCADIVGAQGAVYGDFRLLDNQKC